MHTNQLPIAHSKDLLSHLSLSHLSICLQLLKLRPMLLLMPPYYVTGVQTWVTLAITAMMPMNGSILAELSEELMADSTCQTVQIFHVHLEDNVLGTVWSTQCHCNNPGSSRHSNPPSNPPRSPLSSLLPHPHQLLQDLREICHLISPLVFYALYSPKHLLSWMLIHLPFWQQQCLPPTTLLCPLLKTSSSNPTFLRLVQPSKQIECQKTKARSASISKVLRFHLVRPPKTRLLIQSHAELLYQKRWRFYLQCSSEQLRQLQCQSQ